jgi:hypothetical protein
MPPTSIDTAMLYRVFNGLGCPYIIALVGHAVFTAAVQDSGALVQREDDDREEWLRLTFRLNRVADELTELAPLIDGSKDPAVFEKISSIDRQCGEILQSLTKFEGLARA